MSKDSKAGSWGSASYSYGSGGKPSNWGDKPKAKKNKSCEWVLAMMVGSLLLIALLFSQLARFV